MKTTNLFKAIAFVAMIIVSVMNSEIKAQDNFITNEEVKTAHTSTTTCVMNLHTTTKTV